MHVVDLEGRCKGHGWRQYTFLFWLSPHISPGILKTSRMLRERLTNPLVSSFWYPLITPLVFSKQRLAKDEVYTCFMWEVMGNFNFCSNNMPVPFTCLHSDKIRTLRKELKITSGLVKRGYQRFKSVEKKKIWTTVIS